MYDPYNDPYYPPYEDEYDPIEIIDYDDIEESADPRWTRRQIMLALLALLMIAATLSYLALPFLQSNITSAPVERRRPTQVVPLIEYQHGDIVW